MKKVLAGLITAAFVFTLAGTSAFAAPHHSWAAERICSGVQMGHTCSRLGFIDADGDGVCDNYDPETCPGQGLGWGRGQHHGNGNGHGCHGGWYR